jgi:hypothetical protein
MLRKIPCPELATATASSAYAHILRTVGGGANLARFGNQQSSIGTLRINFHYKMQKKFGVA